MYTVADLMTRAPIALQENDDLVLVEAIFQHGRLRHLPVVKGSRLVGLISQRDFLRSVTGPTGRAVRASAVMTTGVRTVMPTTPLHKALQLMLKNKYGCLPVVDESGRLVGILTESDGVKFASRLAAELAKVQKTLSMALGN